ncbi:SpoIIE family protein phosphatase [Streptomyces sp. Amel2xC10]|uniref:ATP-binding SpoIIE family protein phosphatase n=1 Tax=Streptomyces sp. Amel2xC10 TaxID=1305826 RepID=UPI000A169BB4|nr:SpoIIE family protein phosphatase [Streptomyces sp. Amel2xC10]
MDVSADELVARAAHRLGAGAELLIADVEVCLRKEVPELWDPPGLARMASENIAEHINGVLTDVARGVAPDRIEPPPADVERARRLAKHGTSVSALLRAHRLAQGIVFDRLLAELPALTDDTALVVEAARRMIMTGTEYVDRASQQGVAAFQEERDRRLRWRLALVSEVSMCVGTTLDIARTTQELADVVVEHFADAAVVDLLDSVLSGHDRPEGDPPVLRRVAGRAVPPAVEIPGGTVPPDSLHTYPKDSPPYRALTTGRPSREHPEDAAHDEPGARVHSTMAVPLRARGTTLGVAQLFRYRDPDLFHDEDLLLAQEIAARAAVAVDNARRYTHARAAALALQHSLLPRRTPEQSAVEVAWRYLPAGALSGVGGDWYDVIPLSGARVALVVGDVLGHGVQAAATMGRLRTAVRTLADIDLPPEELLTHLDDVVLRLSAEASDEPPDETDATVPDRDVFGTGATATCLYAVYDPVSRHCALARAGHVLPAALHPDGTAEILDLPPGPPLGVGGLPFEAAEFDLPEGTVLALYTNGLIKGGDHDTEAGLNRLRHALTLAGPSLEATCDRMLDALLPDRPDDDVALLLARTRALGERQVAVWELDADPAAVAGARADVTRQLNDWGLEALDFTTELVVSELLTNAIRYGRPPIRLRLIHDRSLLCEVSDSGSTTPHLRRARHFDEGGRGLFLVAQLAERWGTRHGRDGKTVWAELSESDGLLAALALE